MSTKYFNAVEKKIDIEKRSIRVLASDGSLDRDGDRILPSAFKKHLAAYKKNPVVLACHRHVFEDGTPPVVGRCSSIWIDKAGLWATIKFGSSELAEQYWRLYADGSMTAVSVGFGVLKSEQRYDNEAGQTVNVITDAELYEISLVAVPSNRNAGVKSSFVAAKRAWSDYEALSDDEQADVFCRAVEKMWSVAEQLDECYSDLSFAEKSKHFSPMEIAVLDDSDRHATEFAEYLLDLPLDGSIDDDDEPDDPIFDNLDDQCGKAFEPDYAALFL